MALVLAASAGDIAEVRRLIVAGADPDQHDPGANTALVAAAGRGHAAILEVLVDRGACLDTAPRANGCTAFHTAALHGHAACVAVLLEAGCDTSLHDNSLDRRTGVDWAQQNGHTSVLREVALAAGDGVPIDLKPDPRILSTMEVSVIPLQIPPDKFTLMVFNLPRGSERLHDETLAKIFAPFGPIYEAMLSEGKDTHHGFVRYYCMHDARAAKEALDGKFIRGRAIGIKIGSTRRVEQPAAFRARAALSFYKSIALLNHYLPLGFSTEILSLDLEAEAGPGMGCRVNAGDQTEHQDEEKGVDGGEHVQDASDFQELLSLQESDGAQGAFFLCRYSCTVRLLLRGRGEGERCHTDGFGLGEHADASSRLQARTVAMKKAKATALQAALSELVLVVDHVDSVVSCFFEDEM